MVCEQECMNISLLINRLRLLTYDLKYVSHFPKIVLQTLHNRFVKI